MFTGIIEQSAPVVALAPRAEGGARLTVEAGALAGSLRLGDSLAVNGCCLTVMAQAGPQVSFDLLGETLVRTNLGALVPGARVNLERALAANGRLGGHFVTGHIDRTARVARWSQRGDDFELRLAIDPEQGRYLVPKGCIALDGISLTVVEVAAAEFSVWIIPHTRAVTTLRDRQPGDAINLEFDLLAKYTEKILATRGGAV